MNAFAFGQAGMEVFLVCTDFRGWMTGITKLVALLFKQQLRDNTVTQMAGFTLVIFNDLVDVAHGLVFLLEIAVAIHAGFVAESSRSFLGGRGTGKNHYAHKEIQHSHQADIRMFSVEYNHSVSL